MTPEQRIDRMLETIVQKQGPWVVESVDDVGEEEDPSNEELQAMYQRFLALDESCMPEPGVPPFYQVAPQVKKDHVIFTLSRINYRSTCASIALHLSWGKQLDVSYAEEMFMWLEEYEEQEQDGC